MAWTSDAYVSFITERAKTGTPVTVFQHGSNVYHVLKFFLSRIGCESEKKTLLLAAILHDVGKIENDLRGSRWVHEPHTEKYLREIWENPSFQELAREVDLDCSLISYDEVLAYCENHHFPKPPLLLKNRHFILLTAADMVASAMEAGVVGNVEGMLEGEGWSSSVRVFLKSHGFEEILSLELHRLDLPSKSVSDILCASLIFRPLKDSLSEKGVDVILQRSSQLWLSGPRGEIESVLAGEVVKPEQVLKSAVSRKAVQQFTETLPNLQPSSYLPLLYDDDVLEVFAIRYLKGIANTKALEDLGFSREELIEGFKEGFSEGYIQSWEKIKTGLEGYFSSPLPVTPDAFNPKEFLVDYIGPTDLKNAVARALNLFKTKGAGPAVRSIGALIKGKVGLEEASIEWAFKVSDYAYLDGMPLGEEEVKVACPICNSFSADVKGYALLVGSSKRDTSYYLHKGRDPKVALTHICRWCLSTGYSDMLTSSIQREGNIVDKMREYLFLTTPIPERTMEAIKDYIYGVEPKILDPEAEKLFAKLSDSEVYPLINRTKKRVGGMPKGFVIPSFNDLEHIMVLYTPLSKILPEKPPMMIERLYVTKYLYELWSAFPIASFHYGTTPRGEGFSVYGRKIELDHMKKSHIMINLVEKYGRRRVGGYPKTDLTLLRTLMENPRIGGNSLLFFRRREESRSKKGYKFGQERVNQLIELVEGVSSKDWIFGYGLELTEILVESGLVAKARGLYKSPAKMWTLTDLNKWQHHLQRVKTKADLREWGQSVLFAMKREKRGSKNLVKRFLETIEGLITRCSEEGMSVKEAVQRIGKVSLYLVFYYNNKIGVGEDTE